MILTQFQAGQPNTAWQRKGEAAGAEFKVICRRCTSPLDHLDHSA